MSVSLLIDWPDGRFEEVPIASLRRTEGWAEDARELNLELIPHFPSFINVEPENLDQMEREVRIFRDAMTARGPGYEERIDTADRLLEAFHRLKQSQGWTASIG